MLGLIFPAKCIICQRLLSKQETDFCHSCREKLPEFRRAKTSIPFVAQWTALWYYKEDIRGSIRRFKFRAARHYAEAYAQLLGLKLQKLPYTEVDFITWVPVSAFRRLKRGYDQSYLLAQALGREMGLPVVRTLRKIRHTPPQSGIREAARRRANVLGAYRTKRPRDIVGKRILLVDDVVTTGATAAECAKTLMIAGAEKILFAAVAATQNDTK